MTWHKVDKYISNKESKLPVTTYKRGRKNSPRVFKIDDLDGFYVSNSLNRAVHFTFEQEDIIVIDIFNSAQAAHNDAGDAIGIIELNIRTGNAKFFTEGR
jgi:hypothetical protein